MKKIFLDALLYPFLAILFCLAFGVPFVYTGFQTVHVQGSKDDQGAVTIDFRRVHFWGLVQINEHVEGVHNADLDTSMIRRARRHRLVSGVFLVTGSDAVPLFSGSSNVDSDLKWEAVNSLNDFIRDEEERSYARTFSIRNAFGWVGLPFLVLGVLGVIGWPSAILRHLKGN